MTSPGTPRTPAEHAFWGGITMTNYLVISAIGADRQGNIEQLAHSVLDNHCNIEESRMTVLAGTFALIQLVSGRWNNLAKLESILDSQQKKLDLVITTRRTERAELNDQVLPYRVEVVGLDHPGVVNALSQFFTGRGINIQDMVTNTYRAAHTATPMFNVHFAIEIPAHSHIASVREEFFDLCDNENLDGVIEPYKAT